MADTINQQQQQSGSSLVISVPVSEATYDTTAIISVDGQTAQVTPGSRSLFARASDKVTGVASRFWQRASLESVLYLILSRFSEHKPQAVHDACAYALSTFGGLPQYILSEDDCKNIARALSEDLGAEIDAYDKALQRMNKQDSSATRVDQPTKDSVNTSPIHHADPYSIDTDNSDDDDLLSLINWDFTINTQQA
jgi:hypothetical protein